MSFKERLKEKIERKSVKSIIDGETVYISKGSILSWLPAGIGEWFREWKQIHPAINEDGSVNYINLIFGGWRNLIFLIAILTLVGMVLFQFYINFNYIEKLREACPITVDQRLLGNFNRSLLG